MKENGSCYLDKGQSYSGKINVTKSGKTCVHWNQIPYINNSNFVMLEKNYCRNPEGYGAKPWCYVNATNRTWDYCEVKPCAKVNASKRLKKFKITLYELIDNILLKKNAEVQPRLPVTIFVKLSILDVYGGPGYDCYMFQNKKETAVQ